MDVFYIYAGVRFVWDHEKAASNIVKHGITFEKACEALLFPYASTELDDFAEESRLRSVSYSNDGKLLFIIHLQKIAGAIRIISARPATPKERRSYEDNE